MARVFIGIPTWERPQYLRETVTSVLEQTFEDWRLVVSDNHSSENTRVAVESYLESLDDPRVSFHAQAKSQGEYGQGRFLFDSVRDEEYFMILHDDDLIRPGYVEQAVATLDRERDAAVFVADPYIFDKDGIRSDERTERYLDYHGRRAVGGGSFNILEAVLFHGMTAISGTCFRRSALDEAGLVDPDLDGNYPFELNVFFRLGERAFKGWHDQRELLGFRFHEGALRKQDEIIRSEPILKNAIRLFTRRRFQGRLEWKRKAVLGRLHRALALVYLREDRLPEGRAEILMALRTFPYSKRTLALSVPGLLLPRQVVRLLPEKDIAVPPDMAAAVTRRTNKTEGEKVR